MLSSLVWMFVPGRFARPGQEGRETDVSFLKTHPSICSFLLIMAKWLCWDRAIACSWLVPAAVRKGGNFTKKALLAPSLWLREL